MELHDGLADIEVAYGMYEDEDKDKEFRQLVREE